MTLEEAIAIIEKQKMIINALLLQHSLLFSYHHANLQTYESFKLEYEKFRKDILGDYEPHLKDETPSSHL